MSHLGWRSFTAKDSCEWLDIKGCFCLHIIVFAGCDVTQELLLWDRAVYVHVLNLLTLQILEQYGKGLNNGRSFCHTRNSAKDLLIAMERQCRLDLSDQANGVFAFSDGGEQQSCQKRTHCAPSEGRRQTQGFWCFALKAAVITSAI